MQRTRRTGNSAYGPVVPQNTTIQGAAKDEDRRLMADLEIAQRRDPFVAGTGDGPAFRRSWRRHLRRGSGRRR
jgi:hypothetical protein